MNRNVQCPFPSGIVANSPRDMKPTAITGHCWILSPRNDRRAPPRYLRTLPAFILAYLFEVSVGSALLFNHEGSSHQMTSQMSWNRSSLWILPFVVGTQALVMPDGYTVSRLQALPNTNSRLNVRQGKLPTLGWNSWNMYHCDITEDKFMSAAQKLVGTGLQDAGYTYVNSKLSCAMN